MRKPWLLTNLLLASFLVFGCSARIDNSLTGDQNCKPPCWMNINPGQTTVADILKNQDSTLGKNLETLPNSLRWQDEKGNYYYLHHTNNIIKSIELPLHNTNLAEVISIFGNPNYFVVSELRHTSYVVTLFYPDKGVVFITGGKSKFEFVPEMRVATAFFVENTDLDGMLNTIYGNKYAEVIRTGVQPYLGYGGFYP